MTEPVLLSIQLDPHTADAVDAAAGRAGMTASSFLSDQVQHAFGHAVLSRRDLGRAKRRASRRQRKAYALANRASRAATSTLNEATSNV